MLLSVDSLFLTNGDVTKQLKSLWINSETVPVGMRKQLKKCQAPLCR